MDRRELAAIETKMRAHSRNAAVVVSCQRLEAYHFSSCDCASEVRLRGFDALLHLAEVASGLHSIVLGEEQIVGQVRAALAASPRPVQEAGELAIASARELRHETVFDSHSGHLLDRALRFAGVAPSGSLLVVGTGHMGRLVAKRGADLGFERVVVAGRTVPMGSWWRQGHFEFRELGQLPTSEPVDVAVGCLGSRAPELDPRRELPAVGRLIVDLGTPRNFTPMVTVPLLNITDLLTERAHSRAQRQKLAVRLRAILERRLAHAAEDRETAVGAMRASIEAVRQKELARTRDLHPEIPAATLDTITRSLVNQIFHLPSQRLREMDDPQLRDRLAALFASAPWEAQ